MFNSSIVLYLHVHQPYRVKPYSVFDIGTDYNYFNSEHKETNNKEIFEKVADKSYRPMNALLLKLLNQYPNFKISLSITGTFLEQAEMWTPDLIKSFRQLVETKRVEIIGETYYHSLAFFYSQHEFESQVEQHKNKIKKLFDVTKAKWSG